MFFGTKDARFLEKNISNSLILWTMYFCERPTWGHAWEPQPRKTTTCFWDVFVKKHGHGAPVIPQIEENSPTHILPKGYYWWFCNPAFTTWNNPSWTSRNSTISMGQVCQILRGHNPWSNGRSHFDIAFLSGSLDHQFRVTNFHIPNQITPPNTKSFVWGYGYVLKFLPPSLPGL